MKKIASVCAAATLLATVAAAQDMGPDRVYIPLASDHYGDFQNNQNEFNPGILLTWADRLGGLDYTAGAFIDSGSDPAVHLSVAKLWDLNEDLEFGIVGAVVYSLEDNEAYVAPSLQVNYKNVFANFVSWSDSMGSYSVLGLGLKFDL
jgi:hypothetical protein